MKRIYFFLFASALAMGCSSSTEPSDEAARAASEVVSDGNATPPALMQCESKGGRCTGVSPTACSEGFFTDADDFSCGPGVGVGCCWACPALSPPAPGFCPNGTIQPRKDEAGCVRAFDCVPNAKTACESKGGRCTGISPTSCSEGFFADADDFSCGSGVGVGCCWACPVLSPPAPGFCPNGTIQPRKDEAGCVRGYDCL